MFFFIDVTLFRSCTACAYFHTKLIASVTLQNATNQCSMQIVHYKDKIRHHTISCNLKFTNQMQLYLFLFSYTSYLPWNNNIVNQIHHQISEPDNVFHIL